jgi:hypothetical protein
MGAHKPETRNATGMFGLLIANMGNIAGAAVPVPAPSQLVLNIKKPGDHLSR